MFEIGKLYKHDLSKITVFVISRKTVNKTTVRVDIFYYLNGKTNFNYLIFYSDNTNGNPHERAIFEDGTYELINV